MKNISKIVVVLITVLALTACSTTKAGDNQLIINKKVVTFDLDGGQFAKGEFERANTESKNKNLDSVLLPEAEKKGYTFLGWVDAEELEETVNVVESKEVEETAVEEEEKVEHVKSVLKADVTSPRFYSADWDIITYTINYLDPGEVPSDYPSENDLIPEVEEVVEVEPENERKYSYTVVDEVLFPEPERKGFTFLGWAEVPENIDDITLTSEMIEEAANPNYSISVGTTGDKTLVPLWSRNTYKVGYLLNDGTLEKSNSTEYIYGGEGFVLNEPVKDHYIFSGWQDTADDGKIYFDRFDDTTLARNVELCALWTPEVYEIEYDLSGGEFDGDYPTSYTYETETFKLPVPVREGYKFTGWTTVEAVEYEPVLFAFSFEIDGVEISVHVYETKVEVLLPLQMKAEYVSAIESYVKSQFTGSIVSKNGNIITAYVSDGESSPVENALKNVASEFGLVLDYQKVREEEVGYDEVTIYRGSYGDRSYKANWEIIVYSIDYAKDEEYGPRIEEVIPDNPTHYTAEETVEIRNVEKFGYDFMGWVLDDEEYTEAKTDLVLEEGSVGNRVYVPLFRLHNYSVNLDLGGGKVETESTFTIKDKNFTIGEAEREGCVFAGWQGEDGSIKKTVTVQCAKGMDVNLKALWIPNTYKITYELDGGKLPLGSGGNPESFNVDMEWFTLVNPVKDTYVFAGWVRKDREELDWPETDYLFDTSKIGDVTLVAKWEERVYSINYSLDGGHFEYDDSNPSLFTNYSEDITLVEPCRDGYTFLGWVEVGKEGNRPVVEYTIDVSEVRDDVYLKAVWETTSYPITYNLNGGYFARGVVVNPESYTTDDRAFILSNPVRDGYDFLGWVRSDYSDTDKPTKLMRVDTQDGGALSYKALWSAKTYTITYVLDGGEYKYGNANPETYTPDSLITLASPHKDDYTFTGWIMSGDPSESVKSTVTIYPGTTGDLTFYATYEKTLVALGEATRMQKEVVELGKNDIPRPDWVIEAPKSSVYYYEKAYASGFDFVENLERAESKCREYIASYMGTAVQSLVKDINGTEYTSLTVTVDTVVNGAELVEYWEDADGGVWVLMKIEK